MGAVNQVVLEHLHSGIEWLALMHGRRGSRAAAGAAFRYFPAPCGSGKNHAESLT